MWPILHLSEMKCDRTPSTWGNAEDVASGRENSFLGANFRNNKQKTTFDGRSWMWPLLHIAPPWKNFSHFNIEVWTPLKHSRLLHFLAFHSVLFSLATRNGKSMSQLQACRDMVVHLNWQDGPLHRGGNWKAICKSIRSHQICYGPYLLALSSVSRLFTTVLSTVLRNCCIGSGRQEVGDPRVWKVVRCDLCAAWKQCNIDDMEATLDILLSLWLFCKIQSPLWAFTNDGLDDCKVPSWF